MARIELRDLCKSFDDTEAVRGINLDIPHNEFLVLVGPSGRAMPTPLRCGPTAPSATERRVHTNDTQLDFDEQVLALEPMGMDTMAFLEVNGQEICARSAPNASGRWANR